VACRPGFFLPVRVLSRLFRRLFLEKLLAVHRANRLKFFGEHATLADAQAFAAYLAPLRRAAWVVYAKRPFGGPQAVLAYLSRYTHRVAIANSRLIACDRTGVTFRWKDYRADGRDRQKVMTLATVGTVGTVPNIAIQKYLNQNKDSPCVCISWGPALEPSSEFPVDGAVLSRLPDGRRHFRQVHSQEHAECENRCALSERRLWKRLSERSQGCIGE
jgi:hypothetical protein